jgi:hypothetical protein
MITYWGHTAIAGVPECNTSHSTGCPNCEKDKINYTGVGKHICKGCC